MDTFSDKYNKMNRRITNASNKLFPYAYQASTREAWEDQFLNNWLNNLQETLDVQAIPRSPNYKETYEARPPKFY